MSDTKIVIPSYGFQCFSLNSLLTFQAEEFDLFNRIKAGLGTSDKSVNKVYAKVTDARMASEAVARTARFNRTLRKPTVQLIIGLSGIGTGMLLGPFVQGTILAHLVFFAVILSIGIVTQGIMGCLGLSRGNEGIIKRFLTLEEMAENLSKQLNNLPNQNKIFLERGQGVNFAGTYISVGNKV